MGLASCAPANLLRMGVSVPHIGMKCLLVTDVIQQHRAASGRER